MGIQNDYSVDHTSSNDVVAMTRTTDALNYVTDLLAELQTIANISGLAELSGDIQTVVSKHSAVA